MIRNDNTIQTEIYWTSDMTEDSCCDQIAIYIPGKVMVADAVDGLSLATVHVYSPPLVIVRVCVYCAVAALFNTVSAPSVIVTESLVQVTVVAGPPVEIQVRVFIDNVIPSGIIISPSIHTDIVYYVTHTIFTMEPLMITPISPP